MRIRIETYGQYSSDNYGAHSLAVHVGELSFWFSYSTIVAFRDWSNGGQLHIMRNYWSSTTGKHLNWIDDDKSKRVDRETFDKALDECMQRHKLVVE